MDGIRNKSKYIYHYSPKIEHLELEQCQVSTTLYICKGICIVRQRSSCKVHDTMIWYQKITNKYVIWLKQFAGAKWKYTTIRW